MSKQVFADFAEYWSFAKSFNNKQRRVILQHLPKPQRERLEASYISEGWCDLFLRNELDTILDTITDEFGIDLMKLRVLVFHGKAVYVKRRFWEHIQKRFKGYAVKDVGYIFGGYRATESEYSTDEYRLVYVEGR
jgi:hypothetical protein